MALTCPKDILENLFSLHPVNYNKLKVCREMKLLLKYSAFGLKLSCAVIHSHVLSCALGDSHRLLCTLIEFEPAQFFLRVVESFLSFSLGRQQLLRVEENCCISQLLFSCDPGKA